MMIVRASVLAVAIVGFAGSALACAGHQKTAHLPQTVVSVDGAQTVVNQPVIQTAEEKK